VPAAIPTGAHRGDDRPYGRRRQDEMMKGDKNHE
jgi:hypothetical protein